MDRKSWLWRRKSSEKSPGGETESTGSVSSHSERFFDDQVYAVHTAQSPEVISKAALNDGEDVSESVKSLKDTLRSALLEIAAKEDLVKQHSKVAEEAVNGWEKAENEMSALKTKLEASNQKNSSLEDHVGHLDQALKECVRQLRQAREDQEQKIQEAVSKKARELESSNSALENQLNDLRERLRIAEAEARDSETEISRLETELRSQALERDLSVRSAEAASKQHLEGLRKVAKLEAECRRLNALARKASSSQQIDYDHHRKKEPMFVPPSSSSSSLVEIDIMDDFLEMERLAATTVREGNSNAALKALEKKLEESERERSELESALSSCRIRLEEAQGRLFEAEERIEASRGERDLAESKLRAFEDEIGLLRREVGSLQGQIRKERAVSKENSVKCRKLEDELSSVRMEAEKQKEAELRRIENTKLNEKFKQEKELCLAAQKFAECQKTIASLGKQLKSLSTLEDFMMETEKQTSISCL